MLPPPVGAALEAEIADDPRAHIPRLLEAQRAMPHPLGIIVGGAAIETTITREGIQSKVVARWPDQIGEKMQPGARLEIEGARVQTEPAPARGRE